uniref:Saposin B-type domain-containing protein n=1 Tax=Panagrellus redivivus TaxID=6233 RepID=A0A7E4USL7_PANRE
MKQFSLILVLALCVSLFPTPLHADICKGCKMFLATLKDAMPIEQATIEKYEALLQIACNKYLVEEDIRDCYRVERPHLDYALNGFKNGWHCFIQSTARYSQFLLL